MREFIERGVLGAIDYSMGQTEDFRSNLGTSASSHTDLD